MTEPKYRFLPLSVPEDRMCSAHNPVQAEHADQPPESGIWNLTYSAVGLPRRLCAVRLRMTHGTGRNSLPPPRPGRHPALWITHPIASKRPDACAF